MHSCDDACLLSMYVSLISASYICIHVHAWYIYQGRSHQFESDQVEIVVSENFEVMNINELIKARTAALWSMIFLPKRCIRNLYPKLG